MHLLDLAFEGEAIVDDWSKEFWQAIDDAILAVDRVFTGVATTLETAVDDLLMEVATNVESTVADVQKIIVSELDENVPEWREWLDGDDDLFPDMEEFNHHTEFYDVYPVFPSAENNPACIGCRNYHGQVYNGNILVCGMHPSGWEDEKCPDWESN
ncbi:hypothetical protein [Merismopedia glauca]|uniref:hypothetical protein n=1 Tax=Merismopedia glauca TaxID=292586 RepID=UPI001C62A76B|nr:hypothetical protein [Merismopedia glauca]